MKHTVAMLLVLLMALIGLAGCSEDSGIPGASSSSGVPETTSNYTFDGNIATLRDAITSTTAQTFNITVTGIVHARKRAGEFWIQDRNAGILVYSSGTDFPEIGSKVTLTATAGVVYYNLKEVTAYSDYSLVSTGNAIYRQTGVPTAEQQGQAWKTDKVLTPAGWAAKSNVAVDGINYRNETGVEIASDAYRITGPVGQYNEIVQIVVLQGGATVWTASSSAASSSGPVVIGNVDRYFWGKWTRMDTGDVYHITDKSVKINSGSAQTVGGASATSISFGGQTLTKESENVARLGATALLFRNGGARRAFTARLTGFAAAAGMPGRSGQMRMGIGDNPIGNRPTGRTNAGNPADNQTVTSGTDGLVSYTNAVAGDPQVVTVGGGSGQPVVVTVNPEFDGQDIGTIPVVEDGYSFKVTSKVTVSDSGYLYGNNFNTYSVTVDIKNIGNARCLTSLYEVIPDAGLTVTSGALTGNFSSIEVGAARTLTFGVRYGSLTEEYKDVKLTIKITDSATVRTWVDYVVLRFHKRPVPLRITSQNLDGVSMATLKGFVVHPDNRSARFTVPSNGSAMLYVPWSSRPYQMVFSGAGADTEMKYSFVVGTQTSDLGGTWTIPDINAFEPNNSEAAKTVVTDGWTSRRAYLNVEDIDFYSLDLTAMPGTVPLPTAADVPDSAYGVAPDVIGSTSGTGVVTLTFNGNGHNGGTVPLAVSGSTGWKVTLPQQGDLVKTGATFSGWNTQADGLGTTYAAGSSYTLASSITLYARWAFVVTFDTQGGSVVSSQTVSFGAKATQPTAPTRTMYEFGGWYKESGCTTLWNFSLETVTGNVTIYAKWIPKYTVTFDSQGGSAVSSQIITFGHYAVQPVNPDYTGKTFAGWYSDAMYMNPFYFNITITNSITLYAKWIVVPSVIASLNYIHLNSSGGATFTAKQVWMSGEIYRQFNHTITRFYLGGCEVTYELWYTVYQWAIVNGYQFANSGKEGNDGVAGAAPTTAKYEPVTTINWRDAIVWCNAYSQMVGFQPVYCSDSGLTTPVMDSRDGSYTSSVNTTAGSFDKPYVNWLATGYRLPTEGEWLFEASNGGYKPPNYAHGASDAVTNATATSAVAWYFDNSDNSTQHVNTRKMCGNVEEWCWDWYGEWTEVARIDFRGASTGSHRVIKGGSFAHYASYMQLGYRDSASPYTESGGRGFRLAQRR